MPIVAVPNVSEGRDRRRIEHFANEMLGAGVRVLDTHADPIHHRCVFTVTGDDEWLIAAMLGLAAACRDAIDLSKHSGMHPRLGALDVCPFVPHESSITTAVDLAHRTGQEIAQQLKLPVYFYGAAATRSQTAELPELRKGGLRALIDRATADLPPDLGPDTIDPHHGVVCVGARDVLVAFNVWLDAPLAHADEIATRIRASTGGLPGLRALGIAIDANRSQVSMNLTDPAQAGIGEAFEAVEAAAVETGAEISATEIVGLVPERFLPKPNTKATRLLIEPGRSLEAALTTS